MHAQDVHQCGTRYDGSPPQGCPDPGAHRNYARVARLPARDMTERQLQQSITDLCRLLRLLCYHTRDSRGSFAGFPDLVIVGSLILFVELKSATGKTTVEQRIWGRGIQDADGYWALWRPEHWHSGEIRHTLEILAQRTGPSVHLITGRLGLACGHEGTDPGSSVLDEVTCPACQSKGAGNGR